MLGWIMPRRLFVIFIIFFASGFAGLTYEIVWTKYLALLLGASGYAQLLVLATFMGGLALGSQPKTDLRDSSFRSTLQPISSEANG